MISKKKKSNYIDKNGFYVIENYDKKSPFSSFLSAVAGVEGIPMWSFYVNRGQAISGIGIGDKNNSIMEFFPANEAYKRVYSNGFRTFIKLNKEKEIVYEPFGISIEKHINRWMKIKNNEIIIEEINDELELKVKVTYFTIPNEDFAALARKVEVINTGSEEKDIEIIDGVTTVLPYGTDYLGLKNMSNTLRSYMEAVVDENNIATYKVRASTADTTEVSYINNNYIYVAFDESNTKLDIIVDCEKVFKYDTTLSKPIGFINDSVDNLAKCSKVCNNKVPAAFCCCKALLKNGEAKEVHSYLGYGLPNKDEENIWDRIINTDYFELKKYETNMLINNITKHVDTRTAYPLFDEYIKQCYVDNVLRGGYPLHLGKENKKVYYVYSRKHGDLERDYNFFSIEPNYYSQGNGNFRDVNQNRRMDLYIHPFTGTENIKLFSDLIQLDGYNPLVVTGKKFIINSKEDRENILKLFEEESKYSIEKIICSKFTVGELYSALKIAKYKEDIFIEELIDRILDKSEGNIEAIFGEGFWIDHWTYNLDLIEEYINIYPDKLKELLIEDISYKFYNSPEYVLTRDEKYELSNGKVRQYKSLANKNVNGLNTWVKEKNGELYKTNLFTKLFMLATIKFMSIDQMGIGIEMEAGKPGWNDAMNGLPGLIGSSTSEFFELKRLLEFIGDNIDVINNGIDLPSEIYKHLNNIIKAINENLLCEISDVNYWNVISKLKEEFRNETRYSIDGRKFTLKKLRVSDLIQLMLAKIKKGIDKLLEMNNDNIPTFMYYDVTNYEVVDGIVKPLEFKVNFLPLFLEGPTKYLKTNVSKERKMDIYNKIKQSEIYDKKLKMYKTSESLDEVTFEIGRSRGFTAGWLERESVFMHMEYKYLLELLKSDLTDKYFEEIKNILPPFLNPEIYGRSILENSSFIASSVNPDEDIHGKGFVARLTGTTVEMLNMWRIITVGKEMFKYENEELVLTLSPILPKEFFDEDNKIYTTLLGSISLVYINPNRKNTYGNDKGEITKIIIKTISGELIECVGNSIKGKLAEALRLGNINLVEAYIN